MNIVSSGNRYTVYGDDLKTYKEIPVGTYSIAFSKMAGFSLVKRDDLAANEKIYGNTADKVRKVLKTFKAMNRNMGVILSGPKGVGKSIFARELAHRGNEQGLPLVICEEAFPDVETFISSIEQECIVLFDEFEKTFAETDDYSPQEDLLPLFDGLDNGKKLFVITCNDPSDLSKYLLSRPGRFHYHFCLTEPSKDEVRDYLNDNLRGNAREYIDEIISLSVVSNFTYDILRALCFDLNMGYDLNETLSDLNIDKIQEVRLIAEVRFENGFVGYSEPRKVSTQKKDDDKFSCWLYMDKSKFPALLGKHLDAVGIDFLCREMNVGPSGFSVDPSKVIVRFSDDYFDEDEEGDSDKTRELRNEYKELKDGFRKVKSINLTAVNDGPDRKWSV